MACNLIVGHNDLMSGLILHLGQTITKSKKCVDITASKNFCPLSNFMKFYVCHELEKTFKVKLLVCQETP